MKNKNLKKDLLLMSLFDFTYAGKCNMFITKKYDKYCVVLTGVHLVKDIYVFAPHYKHEFKYDNLYDAIICFNKIIQFITSSMDWYSPEVFDTSNVYAEVFIK